MNIKILLIIIETVSRYISIENKSKVISLIFATSITLLVAHIYAKQEREKIEESGDGLIFTIIALSNELSANNIYLAEYEILATEGRKSGIPSMDSIQSMKNISLIDDVLLTNTKLTQKQRNTILKVKKQIKENWSEKIYIDPNVARKNMRELTRVGTELCAEFSDNRYAIDTFCDHLTSYYEKGGFITASRNKRTSV